jgi:hypothetical protein
VTSHTSPRRVSATQGDVSRRWPSRRLWWTRRVTLPVLVDANDEGSLLHEPVRREHVESDHVARVLESLPAPCLLLPNLRPVGVLPPSTRHGQWRCDAGRITSRGHASKVCWNELHSFLAHVVSPPRVERGIAR